MQVSPQHKLFFFGSIALLIAYLQRERIKKGYNYVKEKLGELIGMTAGEWVGMKEIGNNQSFANDVFTQMMKKVGWQSSDQWCMYFAKAIHYEVFKDERDKINRILTGNTQESFVNAQNDKTNTYTVTNKPSKGDIIIWQNKTNKAKGHAGVVVSVNTDGTINTIEGNTDGYGTSNGDGVYRKVRPSAIGSLANKGSNLAVRGYIHKV